MEVFEFEELRCGEAITCIDIDAEMLRMAVVCAGAVRMYAGGLIAAKAVQEVGRYQAGHPVLVARWSRRPYPYVSDILGEYLLAIGKEDGSLTILRKKESEVATSAAEQWVASAKLKQHNGAISALEWTRTHILSAGRDNAIGVLKLEHNAGVFELKCLKVIDTGLDFLSGICVSDSLVFAQQAPSKVAAWDIDNKCRKALEVEFRQEEGGKGKARSTRPCISSKWACFPKMHASGKPGGSCLLLVELVSFHLCEVNLDWLQTEEWDNYGKRHREDTAQVHAAGVVATTKGLFVAAKDGIIFFDPYNVPSSRYLSTFPEPHEITVIVTQSLVENSSQGLVLFATAAGRVFLVKLRD